MHSCFILAAYSHNNKLTRRILSFRFVCICLKSVTVSTYGGKAHSVWFLIHMIQSAAQIMAYFILTCALVNVTCFPSNILLRCHIQRHWTNNTRRGTSRESPVTRCGDPGSGSGWSETRKGFSANSLAIPKIIPSLLNTHVSFTYHLCYTSLLINNK